ncbi:nitrogen fixation protein NifQ [Bradyrhizobium sediminis]|uniref:Nitrogen fixation protein NifQ n=1 Tax=Bradyrhizobium sediminis TaxID=2840469 RepID=A0A975NJQ8_9BRAD|nr:nitrogen fixation protein NifQ [Bradyrhizobium sediminis]
MQREQSIDAVSVLPAVEQPTTPRGREHIGTAAYRALTGGHPADAVIDDDAGFDGHVLASILAVAAMEDGVLAERAGLAAADLASLLAQWFPAACGTGVAWYAQDADAEDDEVAMVRDLLLTHRSSEGDAGRWLAAMIARRAMEPNHLWEDLGLRDRSELSRLLSRHFAPIANRNTQNMRWKRFFYRALCESDGFVMCTTPVCTECRDFDLCFGDESGESRMADRRREASLQVVLSATAASPSRPPE